MNRASTIKKSVLQGGG